MDSDNTLGVITLTIDDEIADGDFEFDQFIEIYDDNVNIDEVQTPLLSLIETSSAASHAESSETIQAHDTLKNIFDDLDKNSEIPGEIPIMIESVINPDGSLSLENATFSFDSLNNMLVSGHDLISLNIDAKSKAGSCDNSNMTVQTSDSAKKDKRLFCIYCHKTFSKLARHLENAHKDEPDVKKFIDLPKGSKERREIQDIIRKRGSFEFNTNPTLNKGQLITSRRPNQKLNKSARDFFTCPNCVGTYTKGSFSHHVNKCTNRIIKGDRTIMVLGRAVEGRIHEKASDRLRKVVFPVLKEDDIVRLIRYDWLIIAYGNELCDIYTPVYQENMIRARLRLAGRFLRELKTLSDEVTDFASLYRRKFYDSIIQAIQNLGQLDSVSNQFRVPAVARDLVTQIKQIGNVLIFEYGKREDDQSITNTKHFLEMFLCKIGTTINKKVNETQSQMRRVKDEIIPSTDDIRKLSTYLDRERQTCFEQLRNDFTHENWVKLSELAMAEIIVFNRRRTGETQNILVTEFNSRKSIDAKTQKELYTTLSDEDKKQAKKFTRMQIRGKKGRQVPVLVKYSVEESIQLLLHHRTDAGVSPGNPFLFALPTPNPNKIKTVDACSILRKFSLLCEADDPETLRGTHMRKQLATFCVPMELSDGLVAEVADFMGHHDKIHRDYYRHNKIDREVVKMSQLLEAAQGKCNNDAEEFAESDDGEETVNLVNKIDNVQGIETGENNSQDTQPGVNNGHTSKSKRKSEIDEGEHVTKKKHPKRNEEQESAVKHPKKRYSDEEKVAVNTAFKYYLDTRTLPTTAEIKTQQSNYPVLKNRTHLQLKSWISNHNKS